MSWSVSADPLNFIEAEQWFRNRVPLTRAEWNALSEAAKQRAFTVSGVAQSSLVEDAWQSLANAIENGTDFGEWKKAIGERLEAAWGKKSASRLETIFFQNVQSAYSMGRYKQLTDPDVIKARPFWLYDAVMDSRTTRLCSRLNGTVRPADDSFWDTHTPPLHFNCRSGLRSLTRKQAQGRITDKPPELSPPTGFGSRPDPAAWGRDWAKGVATSAASTKWKPALLGEPFGPADYGRPKKIPNSPMPAELLPTISDVGEDAFMAALSESWGGPEVTVVDPTGAGNVLNAKILMGHLREGSPDKRERYFSLLPDLAKEPFEIWLTPLQAEGSGAVTFRKRYIKLYERGGREDAVLLVAEQLKGIWTGATAIRSRNVNYLQNQRRGFLLWPR